MKKNILFTFVAMTAAVTMLACEEIPGTSSSDGGGQGQHEGSGTDPEPGQKTNTLLVGTFNIRYYNTADGANSWENREKAVMNFINTCGADILVMQEVCRGADILVMQEVCQIPAQYITASLYDKYDWIEVDRNTGNSILESESSEGVFLIWNQERFTLKDKGWFWLADPDAGEPQWNPDGTWSTWNSSLPRTALWIAVEDKWNPGRLVCFIGTHYDHISSTARTGSSNLMVRKLREMTGQTNLKNADAAVFVAGDLNTVYDATELAALRNALYDARTTSPKTNTTQVTFNNFGQSGQSVIDHIFYGGNLKAEQYDVITDTPGVRYISDHYPVLFRCSYK